MTHHISITSARSGAQNQVANRAATVLVHRTLNTRRLGAAESIGHNEFLRLLAESNRWWTDVKKHRLAGAQMCRRAVPCVQNPKSERAELLSRKLIFPLCERRSYFSHYSCYKDYVIFTSEI